MIQRLRKAVFGTSSNEDALRERKHERRKQQRDLARSQAALQEREATLDARVENLVRNGNRAKASQSARELAGVRTDLTRIERYSRQMSSMDSRVERSRISRQMGRMIESDIAFVEAGIGGNEDAALRGAALERYNTISARMDLLEETCDDVLEDADADEEGTDADAILCAIDDRVALEMHAGVTFAPPHANGPSRVYTNDVAAPKPYSGDDAMLADLQERMQRLRYE